MDMKSFIAMTGALFALVASGLAEVAHTTTPRLAAYSDLVVVARVTRLYQQGNVLVASAEVLQEVKGSAILRQVEFVVSRTWKCDTSAAQLGKWGPEFNTGRAHMRKRVMAYYDGFSFGRFVKKYPQHKGDRTDLLIGNLWREGITEVFEPLDEMLEDFKAELAAREQQASAPASA